MLECGSLAVALVAHNAQRRGLDDLAPENPRQCHHARRIGYNAPCVYRHLLSASGELQGRKDGMLRLFRNLVVAQLGGILVFASLSVLGILTDFAASLTVALDDMNVVRSSDPLGHARNEVLRKFGFEGFEVIAL